MKLLILYFIKVGEVKFENDDEPDVTIFDGF